MSKAFRWRGFLFVALCAYGFAPSIQVYLKERHWFLQAVLRKGGAYPFPNLLSIHVVSAFLWVLLLVWQLWSGSTKGSWRRSLHRFLGTWSPLLLLVFLGCALAVQYACGAEVCTVSSPASLVPGAIVVASLLGFCWGYYAVKWIRDLNLHKDCMIFTIATSVTPGTTRAVWYAMQVFYPAACDVTTMLSTVQGGTAIAFAIALITLAAGWHSLGRWRQTHCVIFMCFLLFMTIFCAVDALRLTSSSSC